MGYGRNRGIKNVGLTRRVWCASSCKRGAGAKRLWRGRQALAGKVGRRQITSQKKRGGKRNIGYRHPWRVMRKRTAVEKGKG